VRSYSRGNGAWRPGHVEVSKAGVAGGGPWLGRGPDGLCAGRFRAADPAWCSTTPPRLRPRTPLVVFSFPAAGSGGTPGTPKATSASGMMRWVLARPDCRGGGGGGPFPGRVTRRLDPIGDRLVVRRRPAVSRGRCSAESSWMFPIVFAEPRVRPGGNGHFPTRHPRWATGAFFRVRELWAQRGAGSCSTG